MPLREKILTATARLACRHSVAVLIVAALLTVFSIAVMLRQGYSTAFNVARMLPQNIPASRCFTQSLTDFGTVDEAAIVIWLNPKESRAIANSGKLADEVVAKLQANPDFVNVFAKFLTDAEKSRLLNVELPKYGMLLLDKSDLEKIQQKLTPETMENSLTNTARKLMTIDADSSAGQMLLLNALGLGEIFQARLENLLGKKDADKNEIADDASANSPTVREGNEIRPRDNQGYIVSPDGKMLLIVAQPKYPAQNVQFSRQIMRLMEDTVYEIIAGTSALTIADASPKLAKAFINAPDFSAARNKFSPETIAQIRQLTNENSDDVERAKFAEDWRLTLRQFNEILRSGEYLPTATRKEIAKKVAEYGAIGFDRELLARAFNLAAGKNLLAANGVAIAADAEPFAFGALKNLRVEFAGGYQIARRYAASVNSVMLSTLALSALLVLAFFGWCFRRFGVLVYIGIPLLMIITWTGGAGWLLFGQLNLISCAFAAVLVGLGVDYAVHIYNRYIEERANGAEVEESFTEAIRHTGWGVIVGMLTTCAAFIALITSRFEHLAEFGALGAIGILLSAPVMMLVMPALIILRNRWRPESKRIFTPSEFFLPRVVAFIERHRRTMFVASIAVIFLALALVLLPGKLNFNASMAALRPRDRAFEINGEIARAFSTRNPNKLNFIVSAPTETEALEKMATYENKLQKLRDRGLITGYESVTQFLPSPSAQREILAQIRELNLPAALENLRQMLTQKKLDPDYFAFNIRLLREHAGLAERDQIVLPSDFRDSKISKLLNTMVAARQREVSLKYGVPTDIEFPITLAKDAATAESGRVIFPAGTKLSREDAVSLLPANAEVTDKVYGLSYYADGFAVKAAVYPPVSEDSHDGEPVLTKEWLEQVREILEIDPAQFAAIEDSRAFDAFLTGVPIASLVLADIVKEDFLRISLAVALVCLMTINLFFHHSPLRAFTCTLPLAIFATVNFIYPQSRSLALALYAIFSVLFFVGALCHKKIVHVIYCFLPVGVGLLFTFGTMAGLNLIGQTFGSGDWLSLNFVNVLTIPIIIGVGVDNGIHLTQRYFESGRELKPMVVETGRALAITGLTSIVAFGSLVTAKLQGLDSIAQLGGLSTLALAMVLFASLVIFPALIAKFSPAESAR